MKRIIKVLPNKPLETWKQRRLLTQREYSQLQDPDKSAVLEWLLKEQGYICCYTGVRIWNRNEKINIIENCHIEHLKPQTLCRREDRNRHEQAKRRKDVAGENLMAAYPETDFCPFGARFRGDWYGEDGNDKQAGLFVHPLMAGCERRFRFDEFGKISPAPKDKAAEVTIEKLNLKHGELQERRAAAVRMFFHGKSEAEIRTLIAGLDKRSANGQLRAFCFVLKQAGQHLLEKARAEKKKVIQDRKRRVAIQRARKNKR